MSEGLFYAEEHNAKCTCKEMDKILMFRNYTYYSYYARNVWGRAKEKYDDRKILKITCNKCGATWKEYNPKSKYWGIVKDSPYGGEEKVVKARVSVLDVIRLLLEEN